MLACNSSHTLTCRTRHATKQAEHTQHITEHCKRRYSIARHSIAQAMQQWTAYHSTTQQRALQRSMTHCSIMQHSMMQHSTAQALEHSQQSTASHSTAQGHYSTAQRSTAATAWCSMTSDECACTHLVPISEAQGCEPICCSFWPQADLAGRLIWAVLKAGTSPEADGQFLLVVPQVCGTLLMLLHTAAKHAKSGRTKKAGRLRSKAAKKGRSQGLPANVDSAHCKRRAL